MSYVPTTVVTAGMEVSPRARDLARTLEKSVEEFRERNPSLSEAEIRQALMLMNQSRTASVRQSLALVFGAGLAVLGLAVFLFLGERGGGAGAPAIPWVPIAVGGVALLGVVMAVLMRHRGP